MTALNAQQIAQIVAATLAAMNQPKAGGKAKPSKKAPAETNADGKTERMLKTDAAVVKAFKKAGYDKVTPRVDVKTYNLWLAEGYKVKVGEKSIKVGPFRLFHKKQVEYVGHNLKPEGMSDADIAEFRKVNEETTNEVVST